MVGAVVGLVVLGPLLHRGFVLTYDMVFVPSPRIDRAALGLDGSVPRPVPSDLVVALLATVLPSDLVQKLLLLLVPVLGGWGIGRLLPTRSSAAVAALAFTWNPWVAERLVIGHWPFLLGYAVLPWAVAAAARARSGGGRALAGLVLWSAAAAATGATSALVVGGTALLVLAWPGAGVRATARRVAVLVAALVALNAPWWLPALLRPGGIPADPAGVAAFAARADTPLGLIPSVLTLGGIWNPAVVPPERSSAALVAAALCVVAAALALGLRGVLGRPWGPPVVAAGALALVLAVGSALPGVRQVLEAVVVHVPGGGLLRDSQKLLAPWALLVALCAGHAVQRLGDVGSALRPVALGGAALVAVAPVVLLPSLALGASGRLAAVDYPPGWSQVRTALAGAPGGEVALLPWNPYRRFAWNGGRVVLDPGPRYLGRATLADDDLALASGTVRGEDARARRVGAVLGAPSTTRQAARLALRREGVRFALVYRDQPGAAEAERLVAGTPVLVDVGEVVVHDLGAPGPSTRRLPPWWTPVGLGLAVATVAAAAVGAAGVLRPGPASRRRVYSRRARSEQAR